MHNIIILVIIKFILGSLLGDFSYSKSEDDLDVSCKKWRKHRPSSEFPDELPVKKRKSAGNKIVEVMIL